MRANTRISSVLEVILIAIPGLIMGAAVAVFLWLVFTGETVRITLGI